MVKQLREKPSPLTLLGDDEPTQEVTTIPEPQEEPKPKTKPNPIELLDGVKKKETAEADQNLGSNESEEPGKPSSKSTTVITEQQRKDLSKLKFVPEKAPEVIRFEAEKKRADEQALIEFATGDKEKPNEFFQIANNPGAAIKQGVGSFNKAIVQTAASLPKSVAIIAKPIDKLLGINEGKPVEEYGTYKAGKWLEDKALQWGITATDPERDQSFWQSTVPNALGSVAAIVLSGGKPSASVMEGAALSQKEAIVKGLQETGESLTSTPSIVGSTSMAVPEFEAAKKAGATDDEAFKVWAKNYFVGTTEVLPIQRGLDRINKLSGGKLVDIVKAGLPQAIEEGTQETVQQILQNKIAQGSYDPERDTFTDVLQSGGAGFFVGFILPGIGAAMNSMNPDQVSKTKQVLNDRFKQLQSGSQAVLTDQQKNQTTKEVVGDQLKEADPNNVESLDLSAKTIQEKVESNEKATITPSEETPGTGAVSENETQKNIAPPEETTVQETPIETPSEVANRKLNELVDQGAISREGNKITILTKEGGQQVKAIKEEFEQSKQQSNASAVYSDQGEVPQGGTTEQGSQNQSSENLQQHSEQTSTNGEVVESTRGETQNENQNQQPEEVGKKTLAIAQRILNSDANEEIKNGIREKGADYVPKKLEITDKEAGVLLDLYGPDKAETIVRDTKNEVTGDTRTALAAKLYQRYKDSGQNEKAVDVALFAADFAKEAGRTANAAKLWKAITSDEDMTVMAVERENKKVAQQLIAPIQNKVTQSKGQFDEQVRRLIEKRVTEGVEERLAKAKLITKEKRAEISNFFDSLKVKDVKGTANDITRVLGASVWNGSIEAVKRAVLTGADVANAIQAGIDYIRENYKGSDFNEEDYKNMITPHVEKLTTEPIKVTDIDEDKIDTPKISGKKKKDFISQVVDAYNQGELTSDKFEELYAKQIGYKPFTDEERKTIRDLSKTIAEVDKFAEEVKENFTPENIEKYKQVLREAQLANQKMQEFARKPNNIYDTLITIMQGNLLTPLSLVTNVYSNALLQPLRFATTGVGSLIDKGLSQVAKTGLLSESFKDKTIDLGAAQKGYFQGGWNGLMEGLWQLKTGSLPDERELREVQSSFSPTRAIGRWADNNRAVEQKINDYIEGTLGLPAEGMFRLLNLGDKPFKKAAEMAEAMEIGSQKGLKGQDLLKFLMFPDAESQALITKAGQEATFQQETKLSKAVQKGITNFLNLVSETPVIGGAAKVLLKSQIPYVKTPLNIVIESLDYAIPPWSLAKGLYAYSQGNKRDGNILVSKAIVGSMIIAGAKLLFQLGLLSHDEDKEEKGKPKSVRSLQFDTVAPNSVNISALSRGLAGGGFEVKDDDILVNYKKMGILGIILNIHSNESFKQLKETGQINTGMDALLSDMLTGAPSVMSNALDQSFLKGTNSFLNAVQDAGGYETQQWAIETLGALSSIAYPNTISTVSKSADEFVRDTYDKDFVTRLGNTFKSKMFIGESLPPKVNLWGEPIRGNPEGRNKFIYYLFDPTKFKELDTDSYKYKLYEAWKEDNYNDDFLPNIPRRQITVKKINVPLNSEQYEKYATYIGRQRAILTQAYISSPSFEHQTKEKKLKQLQSIYARAAERGRKQFLMQTGWNLYSKAKLEKINKK